MTRSERKTSSEHMTCLVVREECNGSVRHAWTSFFMVSVVARH